MAEYESFSEEQRDEAIAAFRKGLFRILDETMELDRQGLAKRLPSDRYISSALRRILVETSSGKADDHA